MLCTEVLNGLLDALRKLPFDVGDRFNVVTVSFDPREKPPLAAAKKAHYLSEYGRPGAADGWHFLTGESDSIEALTAAVGFRYRFDETHDRYAHASGIMILTPEGKVARYFYGIDYSPKDLRLGLVESSAGKIGTRVVGAAALLPLRPGSGEVHRGGDEPGAPRRRDHPGGARRAARRGVVAGTAGR
jgi:protein SCO1/2